MEQREASWAKKGTSGTFRAGEVGLAHVVAIDELGAVGFCASKKKKQGWSLLTRNVKGRSSGALFLVASQFIALILSQILVKVTTFRQNSSRTCWTGEWFSRLLALGLALLVSLKALFVDGQLGREPGRYQVPSLGKIGKMFLNGGFVSGFGYRKNAWTLYKRAWQVGFDRQPKGWRLSGGWSA